jgi:hypothetical protein
MMNHRRLLLGLVVVGAASAGPASAQVGRDVSFAKDVQPILERRCMSCHGPAQRGGLKMDNFANLMTGGQSGAVIVPGKTAESLLVQLIEGKDGKRMPPQPPGLTPVEILTLRTWVQQGAKDDTPRAAEVPMGLYLVEPEDGSTVRERVRVRVAREAIPADGFVGIYVNNQFKVALAPATAEELTEKRMPIDSPVEYIWDTKAPIVDDIRLTADQRLPQDGPHTIEVRSYNRQGVMVDRSTVQVDLQNQYHPEGEHAPPLWYGGNVGRQYLLEHSVALDATAVVSGAAAARGGGQATQAAGKLQHEETTKYLVSVEDANPRQGTMFWRERRESPIRISVNNNPQVVALDSSSRYFGLNRFGRANISRQMEREKREPVLNPIDLPGSRHPLGESFLTNLRVNLGAYIPATLRINSLEAIPEGMEWQGGERCVRIRVNYLAGTSTIDVASLNLRDADLEIQEGTSIIWFSESTQRIVRAEHNITGNLEVEAGGGGGAMGGFMGVGGPGGELGPGAPGMMGGGMPGSAAGPPPGMMAMMMGGRGPGGSGYAGAPGGAGMMPGSAGMMPGGAGRMPGSAGMMPGGAGMMPGGAGMMPGMMPGGAGMMPGGAGMMPGFPGAGGLGGATSNRGAAAAAIGQQKQRYRVNLKVTTNIAPPEPK